MAVSGLDAEIYDENERDRGEEEEERESGEGDGGRNRRGWVIGGGGEGSHPAAEGRFGGGGVLVIA